jgi:Tfp pilus assembly protein PilF
MFAVMATAFAAIIVVAVSVMAVNVLGQTDEEKLQKQLSLGDKYLEELNYDKAIVAYNKAIAIEPKNVDAVCGLAMAYAGNSDYDQAVEVMETFLTLAESESYKKNQEKAYATLAQIYYDEDEISDALYMSGGTLREAQNAH